MPGRDQALTAACIAAALTVAGCQAGRPSTGAASATATTAAARQTGGYECLPAPPGAPASCYFTPRLFRTAYGVTSLLDHGIDGRGQTVILLEAAQAPGAPGATDVRQDLALFDRLFALPAADLKVTTSLASGASPYLANNEEAGDAEMVHAIAPGAAIQVILLPGVTGSTNNTKLFISEVTKGLRLAPRLGGVVSISGTYQGETAWNTPTPVAVQSLLPPGLEAPVASGGGFSSVFPRPAYQAGIRGTEATRGVPDVAASASPYAGMAVAIEFDGKAGVSVADGTSAGAPFWAGIIAVADQDTGRHLGFIDPAIYLIGRGREYHRAFHDVVTGDNTVNYPSGSVGGYRAAPGWDPVTGWGSPDAQVLVPLLAAEG
jgi:subtilase family serine protease